MTRRRDTIPQELEDPEDCIIGEGQGDLFEPTVTKTNNVSATTTTTMSSTAIPAAASSAPVLLPAVKEGNSFCWDQIPREARNLLAGGIAGMTAKSVVAPMDRIKILYQVSSVEFRFRNLPFVINNIIRNEGLSALWKGNMATMVRIFPYSGIQFMVFDRCKRYFLNEHSHGRYLGRPNHQREDTTTTTKAIATSIATTGKRHGLTALESLVAGMVAGSISVVCTYPLDLTRAQLAVLRKHKHDAATKTFLQVLRNNYVERGVVGGLFRGIAPTLLGILPYSGIAFTLNEQSKRKIQNFYNRDLTTLERMQCGAFAGLFAQTATYPMEVTRRRMQTLGLVGNDTALGALTSQRGEEAITHAESLTATIRHLYKEQGLRGFFKGVSMNWMKGPVAFSISFTTFDTVQGLLETPSERAQRLPQRFLTAPKTRTSDS